MLTGGGKSSAMNLFFRARASLAVTITPPRARFRVCVRVALEVTPDEDITRLLVAWRGGDESALERLVPVVERELRRLAGHYMRRERGGHTLQTTALINEVYLRLVGGPHVSWESRAHFYGIAAKLMREVLVDYARSRRRLKRGGGDAVQVSLTECAPLSEEKSAELIALHEALNRLAAVDPRKSRVVEMRYFGGLSVEEIAAVLKVSAATVMRDWSMARAWLRKEVGDGA